jgi:putative Holliday junction resolvase
MKMGREGGAGRAGWERRHHESSMRYLGIDLGERRIGLAISDVSGTLARPLETLMIASPDDALDRVAATIASLSQEEDGLGAIVVGRPSSLDGRPTDQTARVTAFVEALKARTSLTVSVEDERLTSREAESRLALRERDWRRRKKRLDAAAAAIVLQDYLDGKR